MVQILTQRPRGAVLAAPLLVAALAGCPADDLCAGIVCGAGRTCVGGTCRWDPDACDPPCSGGLLCCGGVCTTPTDLGQCPEQPGCGDGTCAADETCHSCRVDCPECCGDGSCAGDESPASCPADCDDPCGDGGCGAGGCADGDDDQLFSDAMRGCAGRVTYAQRATLCAVGWRTCTAAEWVERRQGLTPDFNYWTEDNLRYNGVEGDCYVSTEGGHLCSEGLQPMRVCAGAVDPLGNECNWTGCGYGAATPDEHFGGCEGNPTAGTLCCQACAGGACPVGCADGSDEQVFSETMRGCAGSVSFAERATLCAEGWRMCTAAEWVAHHTGVAPAYSYWTEENLRYNGVEGACYVSATEGYVCAGGLQPMRVCAGAVDALGNSCNWTGCGYGAVSPDEHFGGCEGNPTAGALCCLAQ